MMKNSIGLYCGSFSPLHNGHIGIIHEVLKEELADKVIVVPTKDYWDKRISIPFDIRLKCLKTIESKNIIIDDDLNDCNAPNTYTLLENLKKKYCGSIFKLIVGADNLPSFSKWVNYRYLLDNYDFIVMNREGFDVKEMMKSLSKDGYSILKCDNFNVSSTFIRENIDNEELIRGLIPRDILNIIKNKQE